MVRHIPIDALLQKYRALPADDRFILQLLSTMYEGCTIPTLYSLIGRLRISLPRQAPKSYPQLLDVLRTLRKNNLIDVGNHCRAEIAEEAMRDAAAAGWLGQMSRAVLELWKPQQYRSETYIRDLRMAIYLGDAELFRHRYQQLEAARPIGTFVRKLFTAICDNPFRPEWFLSLPPIIQACAMREMLGFRDLSLVREEFRNILRQRENAPPHDGGDFFREQLATVSFLSGDFSKAKEIASQNEARGNVPGGVILAACLFLEGDTSRALEIFEHTWRKHRKEREKFDHFAALFYGLVLLQKNKESDLAHVQGFFTQHKDTDYFSAWTTLAGFAFYRQNRMKNAEQCFVAAESRLGKNDLADFFAIVFYSWVNPMAVNEDYLEVLFEKASSHGYRWVAVECAEILKRLHPENSLYQKYVEDNRLGTQSLCGMFKAVEAWERSLTALERLFENDGPAPETSSRSRLLWFVDLDTPGRLEAREQKRKSNGEWSKGRQMSPFKVKSLDCLTPQDEKIYQVWVKYYQSMAVFYPRPQRETGWEDVLLAMVGHPHVYRADLPEERVEIVKGDPEILVEQRGGKLSIRFAVDISGKKVAVRDGNNRIKVIEVPEKQLEIARILGSGGLNVPLESKERVLGLVGRMSSGMTIQSSVPGIAGNIEPVKADANIHARLYPWREGLKLQLVVKPLGAKGPCFPPAVGGENIIAEIDGKKYQAQRDMEHEKKEAYRVVGACPVISGPSYPRWEWEIAAIEDCMQTLLDLHELKEVRIEWPEGEKFKTPQRARVDRLRIGIDRQRDWFAVTGELKVDEATVLDLKDLLTLLESSPGRFIPLGQGQFLALTEEFRRRMEELSFFGEMSAKGVKVHPLAAIALQDFTSGVGTLEVCDSWNKELRRMQSAQMIDMPVPQGFKGELRNYQVDGFKWLHRMAGWGVGACLADDMGLGKTIQAIAFLLAGGVGGPTLVLAPTSVCFNWEKEVRRFAPALNPLVFSGRCEKELKSLKAFDVLIASYGMMQSRIEMFAEVSWHNIVLDEAQAIKNMNTKRSKAVMSLKSDFKLITTGTPVENHLEELWNLFRFINPGLLGSLEKFRRRFANPIQKHQDAYAQQKLKKLVQPFILRRLKSQVLQELPPRTEIALDVELTKEETVFYEALRRNAVEKLEKCEPTERQFQILAEIMKLRRACCHPRLIHPESDIAGSKMQVFGEIVADLIENKHKALVFSQFVTYLSIIREYLDQRGYKYQYLDGSTPQKDRDRSVEAFQAGEGDLFLISLKAGGLGLNLTAADYVIHMDPWWNPAVEDQAADRTHRIGQERPVTIYRLITRNTIEEKIVQLHREKRDLASRLLEGADMTDKMSPEELLKLIQEGAS